MSRTAQGPDFDYATIGARLQQRRLKLGLSTRKVAEMAGVARYTLLRLEAGKRFDKRTMEKVRICLNVFKDQLTRPVANETKFVSHRAEDSRWTVSVPKSKYQKGFVDEDPWHVDDAEERKRLGKLGFQWAYAVMFNSELTNGVMEQGLMEIHQPCKVPFMHRGEEFVYCTRGQILITVDGEPCLLKEGDAMCFDSSLPHSYAPGHPLKPKEEPPQALVVIAITPQRSKPRSRKTELAASPPEIEDPDLGERFESSSPRWGGRERTR